MISGLKVEMELDKFEHYDIKALLSYLLLALVAIVFWKVNSGVGAALVALFVIFSAVHQQPVQIMFGVLFIAYTLVSNYHILVGSVVSVIIVRTTLMLLTVILVPELTGGGKDSRLIIPLWGVMFYLMWEALISIQGFNPIVSYLKLFFFLSVFCAMYCVANTVNRSSKTNAKLFRSAILAIISLIVIGSALIVPFPGLSQLTGEEAIELILAGEGVSLFMGMTSHPQALGAVVAIIETFVLADLVFSIKKWDKFYILLLLLCPFLIYMSSSRTGMGTLIAGVGMVVFLIMRGKELGAYWKGKLIMVINIIVIFIAVAICAIPSIREKTANYALKSRKNSAVREISMEYMISSRQRLIDESIRNFRANPIMGNGFQVSATMLSKKYSGFLSYLTAPVEKGVWIYAVPEEGGIIGMILFCAWLFVLFKLLILRQAYIGASVFFAFLTANFGEFTLFSMSYLGNICWALTFSALCLDLQRIKATQ